MSEDLKFQCEEVEAFYDSQQQEITIEWRGEIGLSGRTKADRLKIVMNAYSAEILKDVLSEVIAHHRREHPRNPAGLERVRRRLVLGDRAEFSGAEKA